MHVGAWHCGAARTAQPQRCMWSANGTAKGGTARGGAARGQLGVRSGGWCWQRGAARHSRACGRQRGGGPFRPGSPRPRRRACTCRPACPRRTAARRTRSASGRRRRCPTRRAARTRGARAASTAGSRSGTSGSSAAAGPATGSPGPRRAATTCACTSAGRPHTPRGRRWGCARSARSRAARGSSRCPTGWSCCARRPSCLAGRRTARIRSWTAAGWGRSTGGCRSWRQRARRRRRCAWSRAW
jgi:hypothetical protein